MYYNSGIQSGQGQAGAPGMNAGQQMHQQGVMQQPQPQPQMPQMMMPQQQQQQQQHYGGQMGGMSPMGGPVMGPGGGMHPMGGAPSAVGGPMPMGAPLPMQPLAPPQGDHQQAAPDQMRQQPMGAPAGPMSGPDDHQSGNQQYQDGHSNVYVRNIPEDVTEPALEALFRVYGNVNSCRLVRGTKSNPRGYGFVRFASYNEALLAINSLNGYQAGPAQLEVKFADADAGPKAPVTPPSSLTPRNNLYVRNLPSNWGEEDVRNFFLPYGEVMELRLLNNNEHANRSVAALVRMGTIQQATAAIDAQNGKVVQGAVQPVMLRYADSSGDKAKRTHRTRGDRYAPYPAPGGSGSGSGDVHQPSGGMWPASGFSGFNADMNADMGMPAMGGMSKPPRMDSGVVMADSHGGGMMLGGMAGGGMMGSMDSGGYGGNQQQQAQTTPTSVFIKNLPSDTDKLYMYEKFAPYGAISSVKVLTHENTGHCIGIGFVNFCNHASALDAITAMNGLKVGDKQLIVNIQTHRKAGGGSGYHQGSGFH